MKLTKKLKKHKSLLLFLGGAATAAAGSQIAKSETARQVCVSGMAKGMKLQKNARSAYHSMKEDAMDICHDAKQKADEDSEE